MPTFKKNPNPLTKRSGFKMRSGNSPLRQADARSIKSAKLTRDISSFFSGLGKSVSDVAGKIGIKKHTPDPTAYKENLARQYRTGEYSASGSKSHLAMKPGESEFQYDVRMRKAKKTKKVIPQEKPSSKNLIEVKSDASGYTYDFGSTPETSSKTFSRGGGDPYSYRTKEGGGFEFQSLKGRGGRTKGEWYTAKGGVEKIQAAYEKALKTTPIEKKSPTKKRSGFKMKNSPAKIYSKPKGKRTVY